jgi:hypothetical protein
MAACPVCGTPNGACGHTELAYPPITSLTERDQMATDTKVYLPKQKSRRGVAGYRGSNIVVVDADGKEDKKATSEANKAAKD